MKTLITMLLLVAVLQGVYSQGAVSGIITDESGNVLAGANVVVNNTYLGNSSDSHGKFTITKLKDGDYTICVSFLGYEKQCKDIDLRNNTFIEFKLVKADFLTDEITVSAIRAGERTPASYTNIGREIIESQNLGQDIPYLLNLTPSLISTSDAGAGIGYTSFRIRGTDLTRINVTINGIPLNDAESHGVWWVDLPDFASSVENVQIQRGVGTSTNGAGAFGATINFLTFSVNDKKPYAEISSSAGSFNSFKNSISLGTGLIKNKFLLNAHLSHITSDGYIDRAFSDLGSYYINGTYYSGKSMLRLNFFSGKEKTYQAWDGIPSEILSNNRTYNGMGIYTDISGNTKYYENETDNYLQNHYQLIFSSEINDNLNLNMALHYTHGEGYYEQYRDDDGLSDYGLSPIHINDTVLYIGGIAFIFPDSSIHSTDLIRRRMMDNDFYGLTYSLNWKSAKLQTNIGGSANEYDGRHFGRIVWEEFAIPTDMNYEWYQNKGIKKEFSIFEKISLQATELLSIYEDIQYRYIDYSINGIDNDLRDISQTHNFSFLNPKIGVFYSLPYNQDIYLMLGVANREPSRSNYTDADPAKVIPVSEKLFDYEFGWHYRTAWLNFSANLFYMNYKNQLILTGEINDVGDPVMVNVPESYRNGIELLSEIRIKKLINWNANFTLSRNKIRNFSEYVDIYDPEWNFIGQQINHLGETDLAFSPSCIASSALAINIIKGLSINFNSKYVGSQYFDNTSSSDRELSSYFENSIRIDYTLSSKFIRQIELKLLINNIFNAKYETNAWIYRYMAGGEYGYYDGYFPQAGRNFLAGVSLKF